MMSRGNFLRIVGIVVTASFVLFFFHTVYFGRAWNDVHLLVERGHSWRLGWLVRSNPQLVMERGPNGMTPLHSVAYTPGRQQEAIIELLIAHGADPNARDDFGQTPLHVAAFEGELKAIKLLLQAGADPKIEDLTSETPLDAAVARGQNEIADLFRKIKGEQQLDDS
ncbi:MAG: ankyrin repeat domain-containing protein [Planctomycetes bacterium]|nr:ankyrin repeat domain-containing protein [Planctomycetota bacterium]